MLYSMTGFGKAQTEFENRRVTVEIRTLNSKQLDIFVKLPSYYREKELEIRNEIARQIQRGKVELVVNIENINPDTPASINTTVVKQYLDQVAALGAECNIDFMPHALEVVMRFPDSLKSSTAELTDAEWQSFRSCLSEALDNCNSYRSNEGLVMEEDIIKHIYQIDYLLSQVDLYEKPRIDKIRQRIGNNLLEFFNRDEIDQNRFEQEMIFYLEKLDINEEKIRLKNHLNYFIETVNSTEPAGRKLGFIIQEIGREINTIGSKANDADIQKLVVQMKDELEKIKEQSGNIL